MSDKKTRFYARVDGRLRQLFSISERASGDLTIVRRVEDWHVETGKEFKNKDHHISLHNSPNSLEQGTTITHTVVTADGNVLKNASFIRFSRQQLLWPIYSMLCPDLRHKSYDQTVSRTKESVILTESVPPHTTLMYHLFAARLDQNPVDIPFCQLIIKKFRKFQILIYINFYNVPSIGNQYSTYCNIPTRARQLNGVNDKFYSHVDSYFPDGGTSLNSEELFHAVWTLCDKLHIAFCGNIFLTFPPDHYLNEYLNQFTVNFTKYPISFGESIYQFPTPSSHWSPSRG